MDRLSLGRLFTLPDRLRLALELAKLADDWDPLSLGRGRRPSAAILELVDLTELLIECNEWSECCDDELVDRTDDLPLAMSGLLIPCDRLDVRLLTLDLADSGLPLPLLSSCSTSSAIATISSSACSRRSSSLCTRLSPSRRTLAVLTAWTADLLAARASGREVVWRAVRLPGSEA